MAFNPSDLFGMKSTADVYITEIETGDSMQLAYVPEKITGQEKTKFQSYNIIERGEVKVPKGITLDTVSWSALLPGANLTSYGFIKSNVWESPAEVIKRWNRWKKEGSKLKLLITQTSINMRVYLSDFHYTYKGGMGNAEYSITFVAARDLLIKTVKEMDGEDETQNALKEREEPPKADSRTVQSGDTLWGIAEEKYGDGSRWTEIYDANKDTVSDPDMIYPGQELKIP